MSFLFSGIIVLWAFSLPFRSGEVTFDPDAALESDTDLSTTLVSGSRDSQDDIEYEREMLMLEAELVLERERHLARQVKKDVPTTAESRKVWQDSLAAQEQEVEELLDSIEGEPARGSIEWEARKELENLRKDSPR